MRSGASSDGQSRDESIGDDEEIITDDKRKSKKGLKLAVLLNRDKDKDKEKEKEKEKHKKEKVNAYLSIPSPPPPSPSRPPFLP